MDYRSAKPPEERDPQVFRFGNQNERARAFNRTRTLKEAASTDHPLSLDPAERAHWDARVRTASYGQRRGWNT